MYVIEHFSISFNISVSIFRWNAHAYSLVLLRLVTRRLAFYLTGVSIIGLVVFSVLFVTTSGRAKRFISYGRNEKRSTQIAKEDPEKHFGGMKVLKLN